MNKSLISLIVFLIPLVLIAQGTFEDKIDSKISKMLEGFSIPGAALAIMVDGEFVLKKGYGFADIKNATKVNMQTGFNAGSISKPVAAWGVMKLVQEGKIDLDAPVEQYLTRWHLPDSDFDSDEVTVRRLLSHTAGLSLPSVSAESSFDDLPTIVEWLNGKNEGIGKLEIILEPGTKWEYSGGGYGLLQLIIEEVSGQKFEDYMQLNILDPLGMKNSSFKINEVVLSASATPYDRYGKPTDFGLYTVKSAAGFHTTLEDFMRFAIASLPKHKDHKKYNTVLHPETVQNMLEPAPNTTVYGWKYGLGYQSVHLNDSRVYIGHAGTNAGWEANFRIEMGTNTGFIIFTNGNGGSNITNPMFCELINWQSSDPNENDCWPQLSVANKLYSHIEEKGIEAIPAVYEKLKNEKSDVLDFSESQLNTLGYHYVSTKEFEKAIAVFKMNLEIFPYAYNAYDSYAEALLANGDKKEAIENYKYSIRLNPENENGIRVLERLGESMDNIHLNIPIEHLNLLAGIYKSTSGSDKEIIYEVRNKKLLRTYKDRENTIHLAPIAINEFVYTDRGLHVIFDTGNPNAIILKVPDEGEFKKIN